MEWNEKVKDQMRLGVSDQKAANLTAKSTKYELLAKLKDNIDKAPLLVQPK